MIQAVADTHTVIWYLFADRRLSTTARAAIEATAASGDQIGVSSIGLAEIVYLIERGRIPADTLDQVLALLDQADALLLEIPFDRHITLTMQRIDRAQVPELPDRIVAATALHFSVPLISRDRKIQLSSVTTIW